MDIAHHLPLPIFFKEAMNHSPSTITEAVLYFMRFKKDSYPVIDSTNEEKDKRKFSLVRSSPGGLSFRYFPGPLTNTIHHEAGNFNDIFPEIENKIIGKGLVHSRGILINQWNFDRFTHLYNKEIVPHLKCLAINNDCVLTARNTQEHDSTLIKNFIFLFIQASNYKLTKKLAFNILERKESHLNFYLKHFPDEESQIKASEIIFTYWIIRQYYTFYKIEINI